MSKEKKIHIIKSVIKHGLLLCVGFFWIYPFLWMISASFKGQNEFFQNRMGLIPVQPTIDNFIRIWQKADFGTYFINTIIVTAFSVIIVLIMTMMAGYAMGRYKFLGRNLCMLNSHPSFPFCKRVSHFESDLQILYPTFHFCNDFPVFFLAFMI